LLLSGFNHKVAGLLLIVTSQETNMQFKFHQHIFLLAVFVLCALPFAALAEGTTPQTSGEHFAEANKFYRVNNWSKAIFHYGESIKMQADNAPAYLMRGTVYLQMKQYDQALTDLNKAIQIDPWEYLAYYRRSEVYTRQNKKDLAEADKSEATRRFQQRPVLKTAKGYYERGIYFEERGFWGDAIICYNEAIKLDPNLKEGFPFTGIYQKRGELYELTNKYTEALEDYTRALAARPQNVDVLFKRAGLLSNPFAFEDRTTEAIRDYSAIIARAADMKWVPEKLQRAYEERMYLYEERGEIDAAIADCTELLKLDPHSARFFFQRGNYQRDKKAYEPAIRDYDQAILLDSQQEGYYYSRGVAYFNLKMDDKAIADYNKAIELNPKFFWPYYNRGLVYDKQKNWASAVADFSRALELRPKDANSLNNRAVMYIHQKQWDKALADLNLAIETNPKSANTYNTRGAVYRDKGEWNKAIADFTQAITLDPKLVLAYKNRAVVYRQQNKIAEADADEKKVKELSP